MWDDIIIGKGDGGVTTTHVFEIEGEHSISRNRVIYRISDCFLDTGMTIFRDTKEGKKLDEMIEKKVPLEEINEWLDLIVLRKLKPADVKTKIRELQRKSFDAGQDAKAKEIRSALGIFR